MTTRTALRKALLFFHLKSSEYTHLTYGQRKVLPNDFCYMHLKRFTTSNFRLASSKDYYEILGISPNATQAEIKTAYLAVRGKTLFLSLLKIEQR